MPPKKVEKARPRRKGGDDGDQAQQALDLQILIANVVARRRALSLTQIEASLRCGLEAQYIAHFEQGRYPNPELKTLTKLRIGLGTSLGWLTTAHRTAGEGATGT